MLLVWVNNRGRYWFESPVQKLYLWHYIIHVYGLLHFTYVYPSLPSFIKHKR